jgi:ribosomal protein S18 acetylase RimI-like enzyme
VDDSPLFLQIQMPRDANTCVKFRRDSYACSFSDPERFDRECGRDGDLYLDWLSARIKEFPEGFVHVWRMGEIVGQMEMRPRGNPAFGYINLFYLVPAVRGTGLSQSLHQYALSVFASLGLGLLQLSVSRSNPRAPAFYRKHGWQDLGPRQGYHGIHLMELSLHAAS